MWRRGEMFDLNIALSNFSTQTPPNTCNLARKKRHDNGFPAAFCKKRFILLKRLVKRLGNLENSII